MSDSQRYRSAAQPDQQRDAEAELIEVALRKIMTTIVIAAGLVGLAIWARPSPHYQVAVGDGRIVRINTQSGTVIACEGETCAIVLQHGKRLERHLPPRALPAPAAAPAPAVPAPARPAPATH